MLIIDNKNESSYTPVDSNQSKQSVHSISTTSDRTNSVSDRERNQTVYTDAGSVIQVDPESKKEAEEWIELMDRYEKKFYNEFLKESILI